jgi:hypothetical protein
MLAFKERRALTRMGLVKASKNDQRLLSSKFNIQYTYSTLAASTLADALLSIMDHSMALCCLGAPHRLVSIAKNSLESQPMIHQEYLDIFI